MWPCWGLLWAAAAACLLEGSRGSSPRSFHVRYTSVSEPAHGLPSFSAEGYVDDQLIARYQSNTQKLHPRLSWVNTLEKEEPEFYKRYTRILQSDEEDFQENVEMLQKRYNQSDGFHIVQMMIFCKVWEDGSKSGHWRYGYEGQDFLNFDMNTLMWTAVDKEAQLTKQRWETGTAILQRFKGYLESTCTELLQKDSRYGSGVSSRKEPPVVTVRSKGEANGMETLICQAYGFYPKELDATWRRDGEILEHETRRGFLAPNSDKTFYTWLSIQVDPKMREQYQCHVEHDGLQGSVDVVVKVPESNLGLIIGCVAAAAAAAAALVLAIVGILVFLRKTEKRELVPKSDPSA